jgi:hypothetical protein
LTNNYSLINYPHWQVILRFKVFILDSWNNEKLIVRQNYINIFEKTYYGFIESDSICGNPDFIDNFYYYEITFAHVEGFI